MVKVIEHYKLEIVCFENMVQVCMDGTPVYQTLINVFYPYKRAKKEAMKWAVDFLERYWKLKEREANV